MDIAMLKQDSLSKVVGRFFMIYFFLLFISTIAGHAIYDVFTSSLFEYENILGAFVFALVVAGLTALYFWDNFKDVFILLSNDKLEVSRRLNPSEEIISCNLFQIDDLASKLEQAGILITYLDRHKNILKMRQKLLFFNKCGGILHFDQKKKALSLISFSFSGNKKRVLQFNEEVRKLLDR